MNVYIIFAYFLKYLLIYTPRFILISQARRESTVQVATMENPTPRINAPLREKFIGKIELN